MGLGGAEGVIAQAQAEFLNIVEELGNSETVQEILDNPIAQALLDEVEYLVGLTTESTYSYVNDYNIEYITTYESSVTTEVSITGSSSVSFIATQPTIPSTFTGYIEIVDDDPAIINVLDDAGITN